MSLTPTKEEIRLMCDQVQEAVNLYGKTATLYLPKILDAYQNAVHEKDGLVTQVLVVNNPTKRLLDNLGWLHEFNKDDNQVIYIPYSLDGVQIVVQDNSIIEIEDRTTVRITSINRTYLYGVWNILNCVPYVQDNKQHKQNVVGSETSFLNPDQTPWGA